MNTYTPIHRVYRVVGESIQSGRWHPFVSSPTSRPGANQELPKLLTRADYRDLSIVCDVTLRIPVIEELPKDAAFQMVGPDSEPTRRAVKPVVGRRMRLPQWRQYYVDVLHVGNDRFFGRMENGTESSFAIDQDWELVES